MTNIYLRNNTFYYRKSIPNHLKLFFQNKKLYIRTLSTKSKTLALKYAKLLNNKFNAIKEVYNMSFDINLIYQLVEEFHNTQLELTENDLRNCKNRSKPDNDARVRPDAKTEFNRTVKRCSTGH